MISYIMLMFCNVLFDEWHVYGTAPQDIHTAVCRTEDQQCKVLEAPEVCEVPYDQPSYFEFHLHRHQL